MGDKNSAYRIGLLWGLNDVYMLRNVPDTKEAFRMYYLLLGITT